MTQNHPQILAFCADAFKQLLPFNQTLYSFATWAFFLAFLLALVSTIIDLWAKWRAAQAPAGGQGDVQMEGLPPVTPDMVKAFTALIESLAKLPVWFALFLAGMALVWLSTVNVPEICMPPAPPAESKAREAKAPDAKAGETKAAPTSAAKAGEAAPAKANNPGATEAPVAPK